MKHAFPILALAAAFLAAPDAWANPKPCPPGLAKKATGCLPPGQAKKLHGMTSAAPLAKPRYRVGDRFDDRLPYRVVLEEDYGRYGVPRFDGQYYARVDDDLLRIDRKTGAVLDIISGVAELLRD